MNNTPQEGKYTGAGLGTPPSPAFPLPLNGLINTAETIGVGALQKTLFGKLNIPTLSKQPDNNFDVLARDYAGADTPDSYSAGTLAGMPIYGKIILGNESGSNTWTDAQGNAGSYQTVELDCAICNIDFNNQVVRTEIQGLPYSVKEFMSSGDNDVTITGIFNSTPDVAPMDFIINLSLLFAAPVPIPVTNYFLNANNIYYIVCMPGCQLPQEKGGYSYQKFTIKAISDVPPTSMLP